MFSSNVGVTIGFVNTIYSVSESDGIAVVSVAVLSGELSDNVVVRLTTQDGSATSKFIIPITAQWYNQLCPKAQKFPFVNPSA